MGLNPERAGEPARAPTLRRLPTAVGQSEIAYRAMPARGRLHLAASSGERTRRDM
jgi:hypothetical protein